MPVAVVYLEHVSFPVVFYLDVMRTMRAEVREHYIASIDARREQYETHAATATYVQSLSRNGYLLTIEEIDAFVGMGFESPGGPAKGETAGEVTAGNITWKLATLEEVFTELRKPFDVASFTIAGGRYEQYVPDIDVRLSPGHTELTIKAPNRAQVQRYVDIFCDAAPDYSVPVVEAKPERPRIFLGHGGNPAWKDTERWLTQLGYDVRAYETLPHSGRTVERILAGALDWANFALLVMTAEDQMADNTAQARQNVVHELGLFQGRLGWDKAIVMLEAEANEFSNIAGTNQLRFPTGDISAKHGDIMIALRENFPGLTV